MAKGEEVLLILPAFLPSKSLRSDPHSSQIFYCDTISTAAIFRALLPRYAGHFV
jgi:hypothetical protein